MKDLAFLLCALVCIGAQVLSYVIPPLFSDETKAVGFLIFVLISFVYAGVSPYISKLKRS